MKREKQTLELRRIGKRSGASWGRGTNRVIAACKDYGIAPPTFEERQGFLLVTFKAKLATREVTPEVTPEVERLMRWCVEPCSRKELQVKLALRDEEHFRTAYLLPGIAKGLIEMTIPGKPRSRLQKYRLTSVGRQLLEQMRKKDATPGAGKRRMKP